MISIPEVPTCIACSRRKEDTPGMCSVRPGGSRYFVCYDCIGDLKSVADAARLEAEAGNDL